MLKGGGLILAVVLRLTVSELRRVRVRARDGN